MEEVREEKEEGKGKKRGRRLKSEKVVYELNVKQVKFFVDLGKEKEVLKEVQNLLVRTNNKEFGSEVTFKELTVYALKKLNQKDVEKIQEDSLSYMEKVERELKKYNEKNSSNLELGEYVAKRLNIN